MTDRYETDHFILVWYVFKMGRSVPLQIGTLVQYKKTDGQQ